MKKNIVLIFLINIFTLINLSYLFSQNKFKVGLYVSPSYNYNDDVNFYTFNKHQFVIASGINLEYKISKSFSVIFRPNYYEKHLSNDCVDTIPTPIKSFGIVSGYYLSKTKCPFEANNTHNFIDFPFGLKYKFIQSKNSKIQSFFIAGNTIVYKTKSTYSVSEKLTNKKMNNENYSTQLVSLFSPFIGFGYQLNLSKKTSLFSELNLKTVNPVFTNYNFGLNLGFNYTL